MARVAGSGRYGMLVLLHGGERTSTTNGMPRRRRWDVKESMIMSGQATEEEVENSMPDANSWAPPARLECRLMAQVDPGHSLHERHYDDQGRRTLLR